MFPKFYYCGFYIVLLLSKALTTQPVLGADG